MKIKCNDGVTRSFRVATPAPETKDGFFAVEAACLECDAPFGVHDTKILKPAFRSHICGVGYSQPHARLAGASCDEFDESGERVTETGRSDL